MAQTRMHVYQIYSVCSLMETGKLVFPSFQREFVWSKNQIKNFLESIYQGYPIGTILVLESNELDTIEDQQLLFPSDSEELTNRWYVIDGRQRLSALYNVLYAKDNKYRFLFDLEREEFLVFKKMTGDARYISLSALYSSSDFLEVQRKISESDQSELYFTRVDKLYRAFKDYEVPLQVMSDVSFNDALSIYERTNASGQRLSKSHIERIQKEKR